MKSTRMVGMDGEDGDTTAAATVIAGRKALSSGSRHSFSSSPAADKSDPE